MRNIDYLKAAHGQSQLAKKWQLAAALSLPLLILFIGSFELFPVPGWVDPLIYAGYFLDAKAQIEMFGAYYFSNRVPFIFVGSLVYDLFEPTTAHLALVLLWQVIAVCSLFAILRPLSTWPVAVMGAWWLGVNPLWIASLSSGYVDAPAISMALAALALLLASLRCDGPRSWLLAATSGIFVSCVAALHPLPALFVAIACVPILLVHLREKAMWGRLAVLILSGLLTILALGFYSLLIGGPFWFLLADLTPVSNAMSGASRRFIRPADEWLFGALRLGLPLTVAALGALLLIDRRTQITKTQLLLGVTALVTLGLTFLLLGAWDIYANGLMLQTKFYASYLLIGQSLLAGFILVRLNASPHLRGTRIFLAVALVVIVTLVLLVWHEQILAVLEWTAVWAKWAGLVIATITLLALARFGLGRAATVLLFATTILVGVGNADTRLTWRESGTVSFKQIYELALSVRRTVDDANLKGRRVQIWLDRSSFTTGDPRSDKRGTYEIYLQDGSLELNAFDSIAALWLWDKGALNFEMPVLSQANLDWLLTPSAPTSIVIICVHPNSCNEGHLALDTAEIPTEVRTRATIWKPDLLPVTVLIVDYLLGSP